MLTEIKCRAEDSVLSRTFGNDFMSFEVLLFNMAGGLSEGTYTGGSWKWMSDPDNGLPFVAVLQAGDDERFNVRNDGLQRTVKDLAALQFSFVITDLVLNRLLRHHFSQMKNASSEHRKAYHEDMGRKYDAMWRAVHDYPARVNMHDIGKIAIALD